MSYVHRIFAVFIIVSTFPEITCQSNWVIASSNLLLLFSLVVHFCFQPSLWSLKISNVSFVMYQVYFSQERTPSTWVCSLYTRSRACTWYLHFERALSSAVSLLSAKLEARVRFSYRKTWQKRSGYKPLLAFMIFFLCRCSLSVFTICIFCEIF